MKENYAPNQFPLYDISQELQRVNGTIVRLVANKNVCSMVSVLMVVFCSNTTSFENKFNNILRVGFYWMASCT